MGQVAVRSVKYASKLWIYMGGQSNRTSRIAITSNALYVLVL